MFYFILWNMNRIDPQYHEKGESWLIETITDIHLAAHAAA